jgi:FAD synthase
MTILRQHIEVYDANAVGQVIENGITTSNIQTSNVKRASGVYVVKVNNQSTKVIIK